MIGGEHDWQFAGREPVEPGGNRLQKPFLISSPSFRVRSRRARVAAGRDGASNFPKVRQIDRRNLRSSAAKNGVDSRPRAISGALSPTDAMVVLRDGRACLRNLSQRPWSRIPRHIGDVPATKAVVGPLTEVLAMDGARIEARRGRLRNYVPERSRTSPYAGATRETPFFWTCAFGVVPRRGTGKGSYARNGRLGSPPGSEKMGMQAFFTKPPRPGPGTRRPVPLPLRQTQDLLGWVLERGTSKKVHDLLSEKKLWTPESPSTTRLSRLIGPGFARKRPGGSVATRGEILPDSAEPSSPRTGG